MWGLMDGCRKLQDSGPVPGQFLHFGARACHWCLGDLLPDSAGSHSPSVCDYCGQATDVHSLRAVMRGKRQTDRGEEAQKPHQRRIADRPKERSILPAPLFDWRRPWRPQPLPVPVLVEE